MARKIKRQKPQQPPAFFGKVFEPRTLNQRKMVRTISENTVTFAIGSAGTGKTHVAAAIAVRMLKSNQIDKIVILRPAVHCGRDIGYLPGNANEKMNPFVQPCFEQLKDYLSYYELREFQNSGVIEVVPLNYVRGRTFNNAFIILDEAQNADYDQLKATLSRFGENSKLVITGDPRQNDLRDPSLMEVVNCLSDCPGVGFVEFQNTDIVRNGLISDILGRLEKYESSF